MGRLLDQSLRSVCRQTDPDFRVVVVHNSMPEVEFSDPRVSYHAVGFPPASTRRTHRLGLLESHLDKGVKLAVGVSVAHQMNADHVMMFDADDYVHSGLAEYANARVGHPGWYFAEGFIHTAGTSMVNHVPDGFHLKNGSTAMLRADLLGVPDGIRVDSTKAEVIDAIEDEHLCHLLGGHGLWEEHLATRGHRMEALPFPGAMWVIGTGENLSGNLVSGRARRPIDEEIKAVFGLVRPSRSSATLRSMLILARRIRWRLTAPRWKVRRETEPAR